ncbi:Uncharacterised protein [Amycolatopsis camponoti]|uniref:Uncharacterized protein n=1 Tax=Amycolatopsis camponoti TaxID=2606593 RepID=A0A6I8M0P4_9PSEU|nr:Uncharacterised protein [Amycolatopsis camponoti]
MISWPSGPKHHLGGGSPVGRTSGALAFRGGQHGVMGKGISSGEASELR